MRAEFLEFPLVGKPGLGLLPEIGSKDPFMRAVPSLLILAAMLPAAEEALPIDDVGVVDEHEWVMAASRRRQRLADAPSPTIVLDERDLRSTGAVTLPDRLRYVPGVDVYQSRHGQFDVGLRGWNGLLNNRMLVVVNGQEYRQEEFGAVTWLGPLFTSDIARVEIVKGPASVTYGSNAFGGVVAVAEHPVGDHLEGRAIATVGTGGRREADATVSGPVWKAMYAKASAGVIGLDDLPGDASGLTHHDSPRSGDTGAADLRCTRARAVLGVRLAREVRLEGEVRYTNLSTWELVDDLDTGSNATNSIYRDGRIRFISPWAEVSHVRHLADKAYQGQKTDYLPSEDFRYIQGGLDDVCDTTRLVVQAPAGPHHLSLGLEYSRWVSVSNLWGPSTYADRSSWDRVATINRAAFAEDQWRLLRGATLTGGVRFDHDSQAGGNVSPRAAINLTPAPGHATLLSYSRGYRLPTPIETYLREFYFSSDPDLQAERIDALEAGWRWSAPSDGMEVGLNLFGSRADHLIWRAPLSAEAMQTNWIGWLNGGAPDLTRQPGPFFIYRNLDNPAFVGGLEATAKARIPGTIVTPWVNGTVQRLRYRDAVVMHSDGFIDPMSGTRIFAFDADLGREFDAPPPWKATLGLDVASRGWSAGLALRVVAARTVFSIANSDPREGILRTQDIPAYACLDLSVGHERAIAGATAWVRLAVLDLTDSDHSESWQTDPAYLRTFHEDQNASRIGRQGSLQGGVTF